MEEQDVYAQLLHETRSSDMELGLRGGSGTKSRACIHAQPSTLQAAIVFHQVAVCFPCGLSSDSQAQSFCHSPFSLFKRCGWVGA